MISKSYLILIDILIVWIAITLYLFFPFDQIRLNINNEWYINESISKYVIIILGVLYIPFSFWNIQKKSHVLETRIGRLIFDKSARKNELLIYFLS